MTYIECLLRELLQLRVNDVYFLQGPVYPQESERLYGFDRSIYDTKHPDFQWVQQVAVQMS